MGGSRGSIPRRRPPFVSVAILALVVALFLLIFFGMR
jgi:hypothetical protein